MTLTDTTTLPLRSGRWIADSTHSTVEFTVRHLGLAKVRGRFTEFSTQLNVGHDLTDTTITAEIELGSVDTGNADRDGHLRSADFFDTEQNSVMSFRSSGIVGAADDYVLRGDLTIGSTTRPVELAIEFHGTETFPMDQSARAGFSATGSLSRKEFGIEFNLPLGGDKVMISDKVAIELEMQLVAPTD